MEDSMCVCVCVCMKDIMATQLHTGYRSLHHHKHRVLSSSIKSQYFQMTTKIPSCSPRKH